jgi:glutamyl-Q tRNA(Asp) synthetase
MAGTQASGNAAVLRTASHGHGVHMTTPVFRFAPSPNGYLHLGHAYSALLNYDLARANGGRFLLRIEDIDATRCRVEFEQAIYEDLAWLGIAWEQPVRRQSEHLGAYGDALERLAAMGLVYPSFESRAEIGRLVAQEETATGRPWPRDPDGAPLYPGHGRALPQAERERLLARGMPYALRLDMAAAVTHVGELSWTELGQGPDGESGVVVARPEAWGDVILGRKETPTSYHLSVVVDDALQGVTEVVRGHDLFHATGVHRLLQVLLGLPEPPYRHHGLIRDAYGHKLSKSNHATGLRALRAQGVAAAEIRHRIGVMSPSGHPSWHFFHGFKGGQPKTSS